MGGPFHDRRHPVVRRTRQRCRAAKATQGGPFRQRTLGPYRVVPQRSGTEGELDKERLRPLPMVPVFYRCTVAAQGAGDWYTAASLAPCAVGLPTCVRRRLIRAEPFRVFSTSLNEGRQ